MTNPDVNTVIATSAVTINWIADVIVPLTSALIGGLIALGGVYLTLKDSHEERTNNQQENARPFFALIDYGDSRITPSNNFAFYFSPIDQDGDFQQTINIVNSEKVEFIINKFTVNNTDFIPFRKYLVEKGMTFMIVLASATSIEGLPIRMYITDINHQSRVYNFISQNSHIVDFTEL